MSDALLRNYIHYLFFLRFIYFRESTWRGQGGAEGEKIPRRLHAERGARLRLHLMTPRPRVRRSTNCTTQAPPYITSFKHFNYHVHKIS